MRYLAAVVESAEALVPLLREAEWFQEQRGGRHWAAMERLDAALRARDGDDGGDT